MTAPATTASTMRPASTMGPVRRPGAPLNGDGTGAPEIGADDHTACVGGPDAGVAAFSTGSVGKGGAGGTRLSGAVRSESGSTPGGAHSDAGMGAAGPVGPSGSGDPGGVPAGDGPGGRSGRRLQIAWSPGSLTDRPPVPSPSVRADASAPGRGYRPVGKHEGHADRAFVDQTLHADFAEYGRSGRVRTREDTISAHAADPSLDEQAEDVSASQLAEDVVLVTYRTA